MTNRRITILGVHVDAITIAEATSRICTYAADQDSKPVYIVKPYSEFLDATNRNPKLLPLLNNAWLCLPDGIALCWAATYLYDGKPGFGRWLKTLGQIVLKPKAMQVVLPEKFAGANATWAVLQAAAQQNLRVALIGSPHGSDINRTAAAIKQQLPPIHIVGTWPGSVNGLSGRELQTALDNNLGLELLADQINAAKPDLILIGMGFPLQERLMAKLQPLLIHGVMIGEGGTFDYDSFGGQQPRASARVQRLGLEWLWRLMREPSRIKRQLAIPRFMVAILRSGPH